MRAAERRRSQNTRHAISNEVSCSTAHKRLVSLSMSHSLIRPVYAPQQTAKENPGTPAEGESKLASVSSSAANSQLGSPRLTLSPRLPDSSNNTSHSTDKTRNSVNKRRAQTGLLQQLDVTHSFHDDSGHQADSSEPTSPTGSVASITSTASESALFRRRSGLLAIHLPPVIVMTSSTIASR